MVEKRVLVTGGTGVLGSEIVRTLTRSTPAYAVTANFRKDSERAVLLQSETGCVLHRADIGDESQVEAMFREISPLFAVVHAAGTSDNELLLLQSRAVWDDSLRINADGAFLVARDALQKLETGGRLIFLASRAGEQGRAGQTAYAASKAALLALMKSAAREGANRGIAVNAICPGFVPSSMSDGLNVERLQQARRSSVYNEFGSASQTAKMVQWLCSEASVGISGQVFHCDSRLD